MNLMIQFQVSSGILIKLFLCKNEKSFLGETRYLFFIFKEISIVRNFLRHANGPLRLPSQVITLDVLKFIKKIAVLILKHDFIHKI